MVDGDVRPIRSHCLRSHPELHGEQGLRSGDARLPQRRFLPRCVRRLSLRLFPGGRVRDRRGSDRRAFPTREGPQFGEGPGLDMRFGRCRLRVGGGRGRFQPGSVQCRDAIDDGRSGHGHQSVELRHHPSPLAGVDGLLRGRGSGRAHREGQAEDAHRRQRRSQLQGCGLRYDGSADIQRLLLVPHGGRGAGELHPAGRIRLLRHRRIGVRRLGSRNVQGRSHVLRQQRFHRAGVVNDIRQWHDGVEHEIHSRLAGDGGGGGGGGPGYRRRNCHR